MRDAESLIHTGASGITRYARSRVWEVSADQCGHDEADYFTRAARISISSSQPSTTIAATSTTERTGF